MSSWPAFRDEGRLNAYCPSRSFLPGQLAILQDTYDGEIDTWDIQWFFTCWLNDGHAIMPKSNLISNIGYNGAHSDGKNRSIHNMELRPITKEGLKGPLENKPEKSIEHLIFTSAIKKFGYSFWRDNLTAKALVNNVFFVLNQINSERWKYGRLKQY
jgi:hypothetical protein